MNRIATGSLVVLAFAAGIALLYFGAPFFVPFFMALMISYALSPVVDALTRLVRWRVLSASIVLGALLGLVGVAAWAWSDDVAMIWQRVPEVARSIATSLRSANGKQANPVAEVKKAAAEIESIAQTGKSAPSSAVATPPSAPPSFWGMVWSGGKSVAEAAAAVVAVIFLVFFMLASGDLFKRKIVRMFGDTLTEKKITLQMIDEIDAQVRRYLAVLVVANLLVGLGTWIAFSALGVDYAELWGVGAAIIHTAPYFGPAIIAVGSLFAAFLQFHSWGQAFLVAGVSVLVATIVGSIFATWLSARQTRMNTTATFVGLLFFGWIWGLWGILLGIPLLAIVKAICERYEAWEPIAELLRREEETKRLPTETEKTSPPRARSAPTTP